MLKALAASSREILEEIAVKLKSSSVLDEILKDESSLDVDESSEVCDTEWIDNVMFLD